MSLVVRVSLNERPLYWVSAQRVSGTSNPDSINAYRVQLIEMNGELTPPVDLGRVMHRFGDHSSVLVRKMIEMVPVEP